ncbi:response regulator transcription factor [Kitasatospora sp. NPDC056327]|uniref:response regulator n=1 Tax=Kitasatospora sp. NPDC056327 TaxID=3345785 RepID=UPI0035D571DF
MTERPALRLLLADHDPGRRAVLAGLLALEEGLRVVARAGSVPAVLALAEARRPDIVVLGLRAPAFDAVVRLRTLLPDCRTVIVTGHDRPADVRRALRAGARAFLPRSVSAADLARVLRAVHAGGRHVHPDTLGTDTTVLTAGELDLLDLAAHGATADLPPALTARLAAADPPAALRRARRHGWI